MDIAARPGAGARAYLRLLATDLGDDLVPHALGIHQRRALIDGAQVPLERDGPTRLLSAPPHPPSGHRGGAGTVPRPRTSLSAPAAPARAVLEADAAAPAAPGAGVTDGRGIPTKSNAVNIWSNTSRNLTTLRLCPRPALLSTVGAQRNRQRERDAVLLSQLAGSLARDRPPNRQCVRQALIRGRSVAYPQIQVVVEVLWVGTQGQRRCQLRHPTAPAHAA